MARFLLLACLFLFLLPGCWNKIELEEQAHVIVIGLDLSSKDHLVDVTFQIANPQVATTQRGEVQNEPPTDIITLTAPDITMAKDMATDIVPRRLNFSHLQVVIASEALAKTEMFHRIIAAATGDPEMRRETQLIITKEKASEFIHTNKPKLETRPHKYYSFMQGRWKESGKAPFSTLNRYYERMRGETFMAIYATTKRDAEFKENEDDYIAGQVPQKSGDPVQVLGTALMIKGKLVGILTGEETRLALLLRNKQWADSMIFSVDDPFHKDYRIGLRLLKFEATKVNVDVKQDPPKVHVTVPLKAQVISIPSLTDYVLNLENQTILKRSINEILSKRAEELIRRCQRELKAEPFIWNHAVRAKFWTWNQYDQYDWENKFLDAEVKVRFDVEVESFGKQYAPLNFEYEEKDE